LCHAGDDHLENDNHRDNEQAQKIYISSYSEELKATDSALACVPTQRVANTSHTTVQVLQLPCPKEKQGSSQTNTHYSCLQEMNFRSKTYILLSISFVGETILFHALLFLLRALTH
jgi:hypothetical protein